MSYNNKNEISLISDETNVEQYVPIQKNTKLFKFILYTTKIEVKFNSIVKFVYNISILEIAIWIAGLFIFFSKPSDLFLIWFSIVHIPKGALGLCLLNVMPKTYEIMENVAKNPEYDEKKITEQINNQIKEMFISRFSEKKCYFYAYLICNIICLVIDFILLIAYFFIVFGDDDWILMQTCMLFIMVIYLLSDVIYFLWYFTLQFSLPEEMIDPIKSAMFGSMKKLAEYINKKFGNNNNDNNANNNNNNNLNII